MALPEEETQVAGPASLDARVAGWLEVLLPAGSPTIVDAATGGTRTWFLLPGERALLCYESSAREWRSFRIENGSESGSGEFRCIAASGDGVELLSGNGVTSFEPDAEALFSELPGSFHPTAIAVAGAASAVLGEDARLALPDAEDGGFEVVSPPDAEAELASSSSEHSRMRAACSRISSLRLFRVRSSSRGISLWRWPCSRSCA